MSTKGSLESVEPKGATIKVDFEFNPKEYTISKSNTWNAPAAKSGSDTPILNFGGGQPKQMKLQLFFDTYEAGADVRLLYTNNLFKMMEINPKLPAFVNLICVEAGCGVAPSRSSTPELKNPLPWFVPS